jgi:DNA (cytosine-5)-methyltransferase 1
LPCKITKKKLKIGITVIDCDKFQIKLETIINVLNTGISELMHTEKSYRKIFSEKDRNGLNVLDLFCGCGGLSLGFKRAGFNILAGIDNDRDSLKTFNANFSGRGYNFDLSSDQWLEDFVKISKGKKPDIIVGGPPCQGFSLTGSRVFDDPRNILYSAIFKAMDRLLPEVVLIENVRGMAGLFKGRARESVESEFKSRGYSCISKILNSANFGVPQIRERLFFIAVKNKGAIAMPSPLLKKENYLTCGNAISDLPSL